MDGLAQWSVFLYQWFFFWPALYPVRPFFYVQILICNVWRINTLQSDMPICRPDHDFMLNTLVGSETGTQSYKFLSLSRSCQFRKLLIQVAPLTSTYHHVPQAVEHSTAKLKGGQSESSTQISLIQYKTYFSATVTVNLCHSCRIFLDTSMSV